MKAGRIFCLALVVLATTSLSAETPRELYRAAMAREQTVRGAMTTDTAPPTVLADARAVVAAYRAIVRQFPASGYSDNALWQAGRLSLDTFSRFQQPQDRETGIRLLGALAADYPTSKLARQVPEQLARAASSAPSATASLATLRNIQRAVLTDAVRIVLELDAEVSFHEERIENPARVFVDLASTCPFLSIRPCALRVTPISCDRCGSAATPAAPRAWWWMPPACPATASIRSTTRTAW